MSYEYAVPAVLSAVAVVALEKRVLRTGLFRSPSYWWTMGISLFFMVLVNGWLTKLSAPVVIYDEAFSSGVRFPWDIPVEDFLFGFSMVTLTIMTWVRLGRRTTDEETG